jgi:UDP-2,4-diacetamido-2,4,6-trideoxy-beta-L-altropyranose hydrolase
MRVAFRTDASSLIGTGHVMRCLALADGLRAAGGEALFLCRTLPDHLRQLLQTRGHAVALLPAAAAGGSELAHAAWLGVTPETDAAATVDVLRGAGCDWVVADHYALDARWERPIRNAVGRLLAIDDLADRTHECDVLLDQNFYADQAVRYAGRTDANCRQLLGPTYALLRPEFQQLHRAAAVRTGAVRNLLVFFGGIDAANQTTTALAALAALRLGAEVHVVVGRSHPVLADVEAACQRHGFVCHVQTNEMGALMSRADLAVGAGGSATWERCCVGLPTLAVCTADNQRQQVGDAACDGLLYAPRAGLYAATDFQLHLAALADNAALRSHLSARGLDRVDGLGVARTLRVLGAGGITIRRATAADSADLLAWRNDVRVRESSRSAAVISATDHAQWLARTLADPQRDLLIATAADGAVGVVRFDLLADEAEVSIYLAPHAAGRGLGQSVLAAAEVWFRRERPAVGALRAVVLRDNAASHHLFASSGYHRCETAYRKPLTARPPCKQA